MGDGNKIDEGTRSFTRVLDQINHGQAQVDMSEELQEVCTSLMKQARLHKAEVKGKMTVTLDLLMTPHGEMRITCGSKSGINKPKSHGSTTWVTDQGNVTFKNPRQTELPLHDVDDPAAGAPRDIGDSKENIDKETGEVETND